MRTRMIGTMEVSAIGLGGMPLSVEDRPDAEQGIVTVHAALDAGVTFIDTADCYHSTYDAVGHNETLIGRALASYGTAVVHVATKGGYVRPPDGSWVTAGSPSHLAQAARDSASRLGVEAIDLYQLHSPDPAVTYEDSIGALAQLITDGVIRAAGISNVSLDEIRRAHAILGADLVSVQNRFSPAARECLPHLELATELGIAFLPYSPLGGIGPGSTLAGASDAFTAVAAVHRVSPQQVALAWELSLGPAVVPIPGASRPQSIADSARAPELDLDADELARLSA